MRTGAGYTPRKPTTGSPTPSGPSIRACTARSMYQPSASRKRAASIHSSASASVLGAKVAVMSTVSHAAGVRGVAT